MAKPILMPQVGQDLTEGKLVELRVAVGDSVAKGDVVAVVESEKASFDVEAFESGIVLEVLYKEGETTRVLEPLLYLGQPGEETGEQGRNAAVESSASPPTDAEPRLYALAKGASVPLPAASSAGQGSKLRSSPLARRLAYQHGVDLAGLAGTGQKGSVVKRDIDAALRSGKGMVKPALVKAPLPSAPAVVRQHSTAIRTLRDGVGDPLMLLHGYGSDLSSWRAFAGHLAIGNPIMALDLPGHGSAPEMPAPIFEALVATVEETFVKAGVDRLHLAGHSLGGAVGAALAGGGNLDVRSLTLIAPAGLGPQINGDFLRGFCAARTAAELQAWLSLLVHDPDALPAALVRATMRARETAGLTEAHARMADALFPNGTQVFSIRPALQAYVGPLRAIVGREDGIIPAVYADALPGHAALHRLAGVGHLPQLEATALVARLLAESVRSAG